MPSPQRLPFFCLQVPDSAAQQQHANETSTYCTAASLQCCAGCRCLAPVQTCHSHSMLMDFLPCAKLCVYNCLLLPADSGELCSPALWRPPNADGVLCPLVRCLPAHAWVRPQHSSHCMCAGAGWSRAGVSDTFCTHSAVSGEPLARDRSKHWCARLLSGVRVFCILCAHCAASGWLLDTDMHQAGQTSCTPAALGATACCCGRLLRTARLGIRTWGSAQRQASYKLRSLPAPGAVGPCPHLQKAAPACFAWH